MKTTSSLKALQSAIDRLANMPGVKGISSQIMKLTADMGGISLSRSNGECLASVICDADVDEESEQPILVSYDRLAAAAARLSGTEIDLSVKSEHLVLVSGNSTSKIPIATTDEWNEMQVPETKLLDVDGPRLVEAIKIAMKATGKDSQNHVNFTGIHFVKIHDGTIWVVGSDRKRLHGCLTELETEFSIETESARFLCSISGKSSFKMGLTENVVRTIGSDFDITFPLKVDRLPYSGMKVLMFPTEVDSLAFLPCDETIKAIRLAAASSDKGAITIEPSKGCVFINGKNNDGNSDSTKIECKHTLKDPVMLPGNQLVDAIEGSGDEQFQLFGNANFIHFKCRDEDRVFSICKMALT